LGYAAAALPENNADRIQKSASGRSHRSLEKENRAGRIRLLTLSWRISRLLSHHPKKNNSLEVMVYVENSVHKISRVERLRSDILHTFAETIDQQK
jgi:hypothetical protein